MENVNPKKLIQLQFNGSKLGLQFRYRMLHSIVHDKPQVVKATHCHIYDISGEEPKLVGQGVARCNPKDRFEKSRGRKVAFGKALNAVEKFAGKSIGKKALRELAWNAYRGVQEDVEAVEGTVVGEQKLLTTKLVDEDGIDDDALSTVGTVH